MTTQIETMNDLLRILREDPEARQQLRVLLLPAEILELPAKVDRLAVLVAQLTVQVQELAAAQQAADERLAQSNARQEAFIREQREVNARQEAANRELREFNQEQREVNARQEAANRELREFNQEQREVNARQEAVNRELLEFKDRQEAVNRELLEFKDRQEAFNQEQREVNARHETAIQDLRESNARQEANIQELLEFKDRQEVFNQEMREFKAGAERRFETLETKVDHLLGDNLEARMERAIMPRLARHYGLHSTELLQSQFTLPNANFEQRLNAAITAGRITREQADILRRADFIVRAQRETDQAEIFCVVEVSWTVDRHDIDRARVWADILAAAGAENVYSLVVGREIPEPRQAEAAAAQVELLSVQRR